MHRLPFDAADQVDAGKDVPPLVVAAHLRRASALAEQHQIVVGLEQLVVELDERKPLFQPLLVGLGGEHTVDAEMDADVAQEPDIVQGQQPVRIVHWLGAAPVKVKVAVHLGVDAGTVGADPFL